jgi:hypothetical protein
MEPKRQSTVPGQDQRLFDGKVVGDTEVGVETSKTVRALTKASRACLLYDFDNQAVAEFLRELDLRMERLLIHGPVHLVVRPWELVRDEEVVYRDEDREKSLAFRLYYDGVRSLTFHPNVTWDELTRLVGILSIRYSGIRQQEDDIVTLLWKARFEHIEFETVESYTPDDDEVTDTGDSVSRQEQRKRLYNAQYEFKLPWPELTDAVEVEYRPIASERLEEMRDEDGPATLPDLCLRLEELLTRQVIESATAIPVEQCIPLFQDIRDYMLSENQDQGLLESVRIAHAAAEHLEDSSSRAALLAVFTDREAFARMVDIAIDRDQSPDVLAEIVSVAPVDQLEVLLQVLASRWSGVGRDLGRQILTKALANRGSQIGDIVLNTVGTVSADLLEIAAQLEPESTVALAVAVVQRDDRPSRLKAIEVLRQLPYRSETGRVLADVGLTSTDAEVRARTAGVLADKGETRAVPAIARALKQGLDNGTAIPQLLPLAESLARLDPAKSVGMFQNWIQSQGRRPRGRTSRDPLLQVTIHGLSEIPGNGAAELLRRIRSRVAGDLKTQCGRAMTRQKGLVTGE